MTKVLLLVGSPRGRISTSTNVGNYILDTIRPNGFETSSLIIRNQLSSEDKISEMVKAIDLADIIILTAPLFDDCQPYIVIKTMEIIFEKKMQLEGKKFIPIMNCGFPEPNQITAVAIPIYRKFAETVGLDWFGSLAIGGGQMFHNMQKDSGKKLDELGKVANLLLEALNQISDALLSNENYQDIELKILPDFWYTRIMKRIVTWMNNIGWKRMVEKKGAQMDAKPYSQ
ncbi:MAG: hypothetical protein HGN29_05800 [Asgard group archaeon]|nr:hypothetical protein [Asgard group archaeon]